MLNNQNILFLSKSIQHGGTENVILQLCEIFAPIVNKIIVVSGNGFDGSLLKKYGVKHYTIPNISILSPFTILTVIRKIKRIVVEEKVTIIHTHHRMAAFYVELLGLYNSLIFINTSHNSFINKKILTKYALRHANLIACGDMVGENLKKIYGFSKVTVIHNTVKPFSDDVTPVPEIMELKKNGYRIVGNIGRLTKQKGFEFFISSIQEVVNRNDRVRFVIVGTGELEGRLKIFADEINVSSYILWLGYRYDIQNIMAQLDLVVLSSLWEGFPLTPIESLSVGTPIVATDVEGTREIVVNGVNGFLVPPKDERAIAEGILNFFNNDRQELSKNAKKIYDKEYSYDEFKRSIISYYEALIL